MKYSADYFRDSIPEWKRKKDSIIGRILYREISFYISSFFANIGVSANAVSYMSMLVGIVGCALFLFHDYALSVIGAALINVWALLDDADGNMARSVKKEPFGEFADGISSYVLVAMMCTSFSIYTYFCGGVFLPPGIIWIVYIGAVASNSDTLMRLIYQKYKSNERELVDQGVLAIENDYRIDHSKAGSFRARIEAEFGLSETMTVVLLICTIFRALDILVVYYFLYYFFACLLTSIIYVRKAINIAKIHRDIDLRKSEVK